MSAGAVATELEQVAEQIRSGERFLLTTHEGPDGDALGSLLAMHQVLGALGKDSVMFLAAKEFPLPIEYRYLALEEVFHEPPADLADRTVIFLDCGNIDRMPVDFLQQGGMQVLNIDHHHDNTRFGTVNLVDVEASCTAEIVYELLGTLGVSLTPGIASALYVGLITDTGRFMYANTDERSHRVAAELIEAGVDVHDHFRRLYEHVPLAKLQLIARALGNIELACDGQIAVTYISEADYEAVGASEELTEGVIDYVRSIEGIRLAAAIRDTGAGSKKARKASLRSSDGTIDVSEIARKQGGGGHARAAGFSTDETYESVVEYICQEVNRQL
ncbi:MAG: bifunctional oligoribonuclease/PAP phosphatase NrnA [Solirubrobacterales bacterium]